MSIGHNVKSQETLPDGMYKSPCLNCTHTIKFTSKSDPKSDITLSINGKSFKVPNTLSGSTSLNEFIRDYAGLRGTKKMCFAGGCGSCVVTVSHLDLETNQNVTYALNSCLCPVFACDGYEITTTEGLGSKKSGFNPIQTTLADHNGSQCGWCSPGMVMNMHGLLSVNPNPTQRQIEDAFSGQICRCTGYRNILDAMKTFASDAPPEKKNTVDIEDLLSKKSCSGGVCANSAGNAAPQEAIVQVQDAQWYQPTTLDTLLELMQQLQGKDYGLVCGSTGNGVFRDEYHDIYVSLRHIERMYSNNLDSDPVAIAANTTLSRFVSLLDRLAPQSGYEYCAELSKHTLKVANVPVRNAGSIAGNLMLRKNHTDFPSDMFVILEAVGASLMIAEAKTGQIVEHKLMDFLQLDMTQRVITAVKLQKMSSNDVVRTYKVMPASENAHAYVSGGFKMTLDTSSGLTVVGKPNIVYTGISDTFLHAVRTEQYLVGKSLASQDTVQGALNVLKSEVNPASNPVMASPEFRRQVALSLFYRFVLSALGNRVPHRLFSGGTELFRGLSTGSASFGTQKEMWPVSEPMPKISSKLQAAGEAVYIPDMPRQEGELHAAFVLSTVGNAAIASIDESQAMKIPGVVKFFKASDIPGKNDFAPAELGFNSREEILCSGQVLYAGQAVGLIVADSEGTANTAANAVKVTYKDVKAPILTVKDAITKKSFFPKPGKDIVVGDAEGAILKSAAIVQGDVELEAQYHMSMETQACLTVPTEEELEVYATTQWTDQCQQAIAQSLNINNSDVHVTVGRLGGAYGSKISRNAQIAAACSLAANVLDRPVRMHLYLGTNMQMVGKRFPYLVKYQAGVTGEGKLNGVKIEFYCDCGSSNSEVGATAAMLFADNAYHCENWHLSGYSVKTNSPSHTWCRAPGSVEGVFAIETIMEQIAVRLGKDPTDLRKLNFYQAGQVTPLKQPLPHCNISSMLDQLLSSISYAERKTQVENFNKMNRWKKRGLSVVPLKFGIGYRSIRFNTYMTIYNGDGSIVVCHGGIESGQGIHTKVIQTAAYELGIPVSLVRVRATETVATSNSISTGGSITSELCCMAVIECCKELKARIQPVREKMKGASWKDVIHACFAQGIDLAARYWGVPSTPNPFMYNIYGATCSEVELDVLTGERNIIRTDILYDCGNSINPEIDVGQVHGAFVMGVGYCFTEKTRYDPTTGQNLTDNTWEYKVPMCKDIPEVFNVTLLKNLPNPVGVLGSKAVGEPPQTMSCSVLFALKHAIQAARRDAGREEPFQLGIPATVEVAELQCSNDITGFVIS